MSLGEAEGVIGVILTILNRFSSGFVAFGTCFSGFSLQFGDKLVVTRQGDALAPRNRRAWVHSLIQSRHGAALARRR